MEKFTIELIVRDVYGVLNRVTGLYTRRCCNIESLNSSNTVDPTLTRILIVSHGDKQMQRQIIHQLSKLYDVKEVTLMAVVETIKT